MRALGRYLWKEWREFRTIVFGTAAAVPLLLGIAGLLIPEKYFADPKVAQGFATLGALGALGIVLFALTTDLFASEARRGRIAFLDRLPAGLRAPFFAKLIVYVLVTAGAFFYGFAIGQWIVELRGGLASLGDLLLRQLYYPIPGRELHPRTLFFALLVWGIFPVACMAPRGVLTLPLAALLYGGLGAAFFGIVALLGAPPPEVEKWFFSTGMQITLFAGVLVIAYVAFVRGYRAGGGWPRALRVGVALTLVLGIVPLVPTARATAIAAGWVEGDPRIASGYLSRDGRYAYLVRFSRVSDRKFVGQRARCVDLESGEVVDLEFRHVQAPLPSFWGQQSALWPYLRTEHGLIDSDKRFRLDPNDPGAMRESYRAATPFRTAEGRRIWFADGSYVYEGKGGSIVAGSVKLPRAGHPAGMGVQFFSKGIFDVTRRALLPVKARVLYARPGKWLCKKRRIQDPWSLYDPETGRWSEPKGIDNEDYFAALHDDGRLFVVRPDRKLVLLDPETGAETAVRDESGQLVEATRSWHGFRDATRFGRCAARTPGNARVFLVDGVPARFEAETNVLVRAGIEPSKGVVFLGCPDEETAYLLVDDLHLDRVRFGSSERTRIYSED